MMKFGIGVVPAGEITFHALAELGQLAEASGWDGLCYKETCGAGWQDISPDDVRAFKVFTEAKHPSSTPFSICVGGRERSANWEKDHAYISAVAEAGATWWMEFIEPTSFAETRQKVLRRPLRIDCLED